MVSETERIRELEARLEQLERELSRRQGGRIPDLLESLIPGEVRGHLRAAFREQMLAVSAYLDYVAGKANEAADAADMDTKERRRIPVE
jgi:hypothetical protein